MRWSKMTETDTFEFEISVWYIVPSEWVDSDRDGIIVSDAEVVGEKGNEHLTVELTRLKVEDNND